MELSQLWAAARRRLWVVILMAIIAAGSAASLSKWYLPKVYGATVTLMVIPSPSSGTDYITTLVTGQQMVATYAALATSPNVLSEAVQAVPGAPSISTLTKDVTAAPESGTNLMTLTVKAASATLAAQLSDSLATTLVNAVTRVTGQASLKVVAFARPDHTPVSPRLARTTAMALALGIVLGFFVAFIWNSLDDAIRQEDELAQVLDCPVLGVISTIPAGTRATNRKRAREASARRQRSVSP
ncbi:MAG: Wzz/FepE/Etk N-terminal domain-containing protein [Firmicutes bacterium]|nr:Wzz/FepE/Etk N-terminal domain-containing protein [Bacillota bacterium]